MSETFAIKDWDRVFENYRSRELSELKHVSWPTRQDSGGFAILSRSYEGHAALGMFGALVQIAARANPRGVLADDRGAWTAARYAKRFGITEEEAARLWNLLTSEDVAWLVPHCPVDSRVTDSAPTAHDAAPTAHRPTTDAPPLDWNGLERSGLEKEPASEPALPPGFVRFWDAYPRTRRTDKVKSLGHWRRQGLERRVDEVMRSLEAWKLCKDWTDDGGQYVCGPAVWLNKKRWQDFPEPANSSKATGPNTGGVALGAW